MATTIGTLTLVSVGATTDVISVPAATGGTSPYTYQTYRSTASGFTPGSTNAIAGATGLTVNDSGLTPGTQYYYKTVATDSSGTPVTATSAQLSVLTTAASPSPNQFTGSPTLGQLDLPYNVNTLPVQFDPAGSGTLVAGQAVKWSTNSSGGPPMVVPSLAASDVVAGFVNYNIKNAQFNPGDPMEISMSGNVMYLYAALALTRGQFLTSLPAAVAGGCNGGVVPVTGSSGNPIIGWALNTVNIGALTRVMLTTPAAPYAID